jgi:hypothetical protein
MASQDGFLERSTRNRDLDHAPPIGGPPAPGRRQTPPKRRRILAIAVYAVLLVAPGMAEIEKLARPCREGLCFYWWPKLPLVSGWHQDLGPSFENEMDILVPEGSTFSDAETIIYGRAIYKPGETERKSVEQLIESDIREFAARFPEATVREADPVTDGDRKQLRSVTFFPKATGNWERVAYGEEGDYLLIFTLSSRSLEGYNASMATYERILGLYREKPEAAPQAPMEPEP